MGVTHLLYHIIIKDFKANVLNTTLLSIGIASLIPILFTLSPISVQQAALSGELFVPLIAIIILPTVFLPDQEKSIRAVINSKRYQLPMLHFLRTTWFLILLSLLDTNIIITYGLNHTSIALLPLLADFITKNFLLAGVIVASYRVTNNIGIMYILPVTYLTLCLGYTGLGPFNLLSLVHNRPISDCWWQLLSAVMLLTFGLIPLTNLRQKRKSFLSKLNS